MTSVHVTSVPCLTNVSTLLDRALTCQRERQGVNDVGFLTERACGKAEDMLSQAFQDRSNGSLAMQDFL